MSPQPAVTFKEVSKKFFKGSTHYGTLRDDIVGMFSRKPKKNILRSNEFWALNKVSFCINRGEKIGLYGPNGSGKSTLLKLIARVITPTEGSVDVNGRIAPLIELGAGFHPDLDGMENIYMNGAMLGMSFSQIKAKMSSIIEYSELESFITTPIKKYSSGMKLRLGFSVAIHSQAEIFLLDEILAVGDAEFKQKSFQSIKELTRQNKTLLIVSHNKDTLGTLTNRILYLKNGALIEDRT